MDGSQNLLGKQICNRLTSGLRLALPDQELRLGTAAASGPPRPLALAPPHREVRPGQNRPPQQPSVFPGRGHGDLLSIAISKFCWFLKKGDETMTVAENS
ncbi:hypothetical protein WISP_73969 [Willisornis vidua]|uniref:Uncharacterized protein n=1 Tax=Willisornis vidua TaxID=1566151 RepID=A0ABQ9DBW7_9PASS|nr:hypothetical protein WISP_73969 [Willisornis vidua]